MKRAEKMALLKNATADGMTRKRCIQLLKNLFPGSRYADRLRMAVHSFNYRR